MTRGGAPVGEEAPYLNLYNSMASDSKNNPSGFADPEMDAMITAVQTASTDDAVREAISKVQEYANVTVPYVIWGPASVLTAWDGNVQRRRTQHHRHHVLGRRLDLAQRRNGGTMKWSLAGAMIDALELCELAQVAEEVGFDGKSRCPDSVFYPEQVSAPYPYTADGKRMWAPETPMPDPFIAMAAMAAVTSRIQFYTNVFKLPLRDPLVDSQADRDHGCDVEEPRPALGVGLSWIPEEFTFTGTEMAHPRCAYRRSHRDHQGGVCGTWAGMGRIPRQALRFRRFDDQSCSGNSGSDLHRWATANRGCVVQPGWLTVGCPVNTTKAEFIVRHRSSHGIAGRVRSCRCSFRRQRLADGCS